MPPRADGEALSRETLALLEAPPPGTAPWVPALYRALAYLTLGKAQAARGEPRVARRSWQLGTELLATFTGPRGRVHRALGLLYLGRVDEARPVAREALARYRHPELIELCRRHGIEVPTLE